MWSLHCNCFSSCIYTCTSCDRWLNFRFTNGYGYIGFRTLYAIHDLSNLQWIFIHKLCLWWCMVAVQASCKGNCPVTIASNCNFRKSRIIDRYFYFGSCNPCSSQSSISRGNFISNCWRYCWGYWFNFVVKVISLWIPIGIRSSDFRYMDSWTLSRVNCTLKGWSGVGSRFRGCCLVTEISTKLPAINPAWCISYRQTINRSWIIPYFDSRIESFSLSNLIQNRICIIFTYWKRSPIHTNYRRNSVRCSFLIGHLRLYPSMQGSVVISISFRYIDNCLNNIGSQF